MSRVTLRDYQREAEDAVWASWREHSSTLVVLPTGCGKTELFVSIGGSFTGGRTLMIAPTIELVYQAQRKFGERTGVYPAVEQAGMTSNEHPSMRSPFVCASKQTLAATRGGRKRYERLQDIGLVIVDEAHLAATKQFGEIIGHFRDRGAKVLGVTATPKRADGVGLRTLFEDCAYEMWIPDAIDRGWLVSPQAIACQIESLDLSEVGTKGVRGDFKDGDLAGVMEEEQVVFEIAEVTAREASVEGRVLKTVVYCPTVNVAKAVSDRLNDRHGIRSRMVCGDKRRCSDLDRKNILEEFAEGPLQVICNVGVLTTGWDFPGLEHIVMARPTRSVGLYTQILGRGTRPLPGVVDFEGSTPTSRRQAIADSAKPHFKVTDLYDNSLQHKLVGVADVLAGSMELAEPKGKPSLDQAAAEAVAKQLRLGESVDVRAAIAAAKEAERQRREEEEERRRQRQKVASEAKYQRVEVDPFDASQRGRVQSRQGVGYRMPFGKHRGQKIGELDSKYLNSLLWANEKAEKPLYLSPKLKYLIESELSGRSAAKKAAREARRPKPVPAAAPPTNFKTFADLTAALERQMAG